jgi:hypothetical protein
VDVPLFGWNNAQAVVAVKLEKETFITFKVGGGVPAAARA